MIRIIIPLLLVLSCGAVHAAGTPDDAAVRAVWSEIDATWNARDVDGFSRLYTEDSSFVFVDRRQAFAGRDEIHRHFSAQFPQTPLEFSHHATINETRVIAEGVMTADGVVEIFRAPPEGDGEPTLFRTFAIFALMVKDGDEWLIDALRIYLMQ